MADFGHAKADFLREFLELPNGTPCHDTFSRVFRLIKPASFQHLFDKYRADFAQDRDARRAIAMDGKEMRRSFDRAADKTGLNVVTAFAHGARLSLGVIESTKAGGEIMALRKLIKMLDINGTMITADALHCQRETCELIVQEGGVYCLQLKGSQGAMQADVQAFINHQITEYIDEYISTDADYGRIEERFYRAYKPHKYLKDSHKWPHLEAFIHVTSTRELNGKSSQSERVYLMSKRLIFRDAAAIIRGHWQIENSLHPLSGM